jgi:N6-L-threonylcarbamoyladenine synthase
LGCTRDDAAGEAFDKVAKLMGLGYPGGPIIDKLSKRGNKDKIKFPRPLMWPTWEFSFSGLKTAVVNYVKGAKSLERKDKADIAASFQQAVADTLVEKTVKAAKKHKLKKIVLGGGVAANSCLRKDMAKSCKKEGLRVYLPPVNLCTDNAAMIACAGYYKFISSKNTLKGWKTTRVEPNLKLSDW